MLFNGLIPIAQPPEEGKQIKAKGTGKYMSTRTNNIYYVKRSNFFPGDDLAEYISSQILTALVGDNAAECQLVLNNLTKQTFLASQVAQGTLHEALQKQGKISGCWHEAARDSVYSKLQRRSLQADFAQILAASMLIGDYDIHPGNFILYKDKHGHDRIYKMDHGWGLHNIFSSSDGNIMAVRRAFGMYGSWFRLMPTNHFNNYPDLIYNEDFITAIDSVLEKSNTDHLSRILEGSIDRIGRLFAKNPAKQLELFSLLAMHIGDADFEDALSRIKSLEQKCATAKVRLQGAILTGIERRKNMLHALKREISQYIVDQAIKQRRVKIGNNVTFFSGIVSTADEFNDLQNSSLLPIERQLAAMGKSVTPSNITKFLLEYNYLLDQDKLALILCNKENSKYLTSLFTALPIENHSPAFALSLVLRSGVILIPTDPDRLSNMIEAFTRAYLTKSPNSFLHKFPEKAQRDFFGQIFCLMASSNFDNQNMSLRNFYESLPPEFRAYGDIEFYAPIYDEVVTTSIDFNFARQTGYLFERTDFMKEKKFVELINILSTKAGRENISKSYTFLPPECKAHVELIPSWLQYLTGTKWQVKIYTSNQQCICSINYYQPSTLLRIFGTKEQLKFLPSPEHRHSLDYTAQLARELHIDHQKIFGDEHFSIEDIKRSLNMALEQSKFKKAPATKRKTPPPHKTKSTHHRPSKKGRFS